MKLKNIAKYFSVIDKHVYRTNKDFAAGYRDSKYQHILYDKNLLNITHTLYLVRKSFEKIIFIGPNPDILLTSLPWSKCYN
jgi:hypothetical protein